MLCHRFNLEVNNVWRQMIGNGTSSGREIRLIIMVKIFSLFIVTGELLVVAGTAMRCDIFLLCQASCTGRCGMHPLPGRRTLLLLQGQRTLRSLASGVMLLRPEVRGHGLRHGPRSNHLVQPKNWWPFTSRRCLALEQWIDGWAKSGRLRSIGPTWMLEVLSAQSSYWYRTMEDAAENL